MNLSKIRVDPQIPGGHSALNTSRHYRINPELGINTAAETQNGAARLRVTGAGGAIGHGRTLARARAAAHIHPLKAARCANLAAWQGVTGSGNNMPRGVPPVCAAGAVRRRPVMPPAATGAPGARPNAQEKRLKIQEAASATPGGAHGGLCSDCGAPSQGASRCPPCARRSWARSGEHRGLPVLPPRYTVIEIATGVNHGYLEQDLIPSEVPQQADSCGFSTDLLGINPDRHFPPRRLIRLSLAPGKAPGRIDGGALATRIPSFSAGLARR